MGKFDGMLICTDLDGTLLRDDKTVSAKNLEAIEYFKSEGGYFTIVTGRMYFFAGGICDIVKPNCPIGCINGGAVYDYSAKKYVWQKELKADAKELVQYIADRVPTAGIQLNAFERIWFCRENGVMEEFRRLTGVPELSAGIWEVDEPLAKVVFGDDEDGILRIKELLDGHSRADEFDFIRSERSLYEILPKGINKGVALEKIAEHLGIDMKKTVAVGDYNNDIGMLKAAGCGVAVANATEDTKNAADYITVSNMEDAIAAVIFDIERGGSGGDR